MGASKGTIEWPAVDPRAPTPWLWSARQDLFWIAGGGSLLFTLLAVPITLALPHAADLLVVGFLHLGAFCNYPHYAVTYQLIVRERGRAPSSYFWLIASAPIAVGALVLGVVYTPAIGAVVRLYLSWSVYHYAAQHFGLAAMYQGRAKQALSDKEKRALQLGFIAVCLHLLILLNMDHGLGSEDAFGVVGGALLAGPLIPASLYPLALLPVAIGIVLHILAERWHKERTGKPLVPMARLLVATNFVWFVLPYLRLPGHDHPWTGSTIATWVPFALPFFHCAQYLGVTGWRARTTGSIKPVLYYALLVGVGLLLFEGITRGLDAVSTVGATRAFLLVPAVLNIHHFFLDGLMWKRARAPKPVVATATLLLMLLGCVSCGGTKPKESATPDEGESGFVTAESKCLAIAGATHERPKNEPDTIVVKHILVKFAGAKKASADIKRSRGDACIRASEARHRLEKGETFGEIVSEYSDEPGAASREGLIGPIKRKDVVAAFADAAFELKANEVSQVVETESGFHVILRTE